MSKIRLFGVNIFMGPAVVVLSSFLASHTWAVYPSSAGEEGSQEDSKQESPGDRKKKKLSLRMKTINK